MRKYRRRRKVILSEKRGNFEILEAHYLGGCYWPGKSIDRLSNKQLAQEMIRLCRYNVVEIW